MGGNEVFFPRKFHQTVCLQQQMNSRKQPRHYLQSQPIHSPEHFAQSRAIIQPFKSSYYSGKTIYSYHPSSTWTVCHPSKSTKWIDRPGKYPVFSGILHIFMLRQLNDYYIFAFASLEIILWPVIVGHGKYFMHITPAIFSPPHSCRARPMLLLRFNLIGANKLVQFIAPTNG